ncbi:MAG: TIR domain-containing protein [Planctomycetaceae bacterium]|nr:TIR domain-containing protein [Planctomycetaceae bacterium]
MRYKGFLSYSRKDTRVAKRLHRALERYRIPRGIASTASHRKLGRFFRDDDELRATEHLGSALDGAIDDSETLIVLASPDAAGSTWVDKEIRRFQRRTAPRVFAVIVRGLPNVDDATRECFPAALKFRAGADGKSTGERAELPLAVDLTTERFARAFLRLVAGLLDIEFDALWQRERRRARVRRVIWALSLGAVVFAAALLAATALTSIDAASLRDRSVEISAEQWRYFGEPRAFDPALRAALAAGRLDRPGPGPLSATNSRSDDTARALALSGRALPVRRVHGEAPDMTKRDNFRDDILDADPAQRVAIHAPSSARALSFSADSERLGISTSSGLVVVHDIASGASVYSAVLSGVDASARIALDERGGQALVGSRSGLQRIDTSSGTATTCSPDKLRGFHELGWVAGRWVFAASGAGNAVVGAFDPVACRIAESVEIPEFTPYNSHTISAGGTVFLGFDPDHGLTPVLAGFHRAPSVLFSGLGDGVGQVKIIAAESKGKLVALGGNGSGGGARAGVQIVSRESEAEVARLSGHTGEVYAIDFLPGSDIVATGGSDFSIRLWERTSGKEVIRLAGHVGDIFDLRFSPNGRWLATGSSDGAVLLWDVSSLLEPRTSPLWVVASQRPPGVWLWPSTVVTRVERQATRAFVGRPWDILEWRDPFTVSGAIQSLRALLVRSFGWSQLDCDPPPETRMR